MRQSPDAGERVPGEKRNKGKQLMKRNPKPVEQISHDLKRAKKDLDLAEQHIREQKKEYYELQKRVERIPNRSPLSQAYEPEQLAFPSPGPSRFVVLSGAARGGRPGRGRGIRARVDPAEVGARVPEVAPTYAPREEGRGRARGRAFRASGQAGPANVGRRVVVKDDDKDDKEKKD